MWMISKLTQYISGVFFPQECFVCKKSGACLCSACLRSIPAPIDTPGHFISSRYSYKDIRIKRVIHAIKFFHRRDLAVPLSEELLTLLPETSSTTVLVPIPMPLLRRVLRGYNQSELLAKQLGRLAQLEVDTKLLARNTTPLRQVKTHNRKERLRNQKNAFKASRKAEGKDIILVDDVTTTGATLTEARNKLLSKGARSVIAITIAH